MNTDSASALLRPSTRADNDFFYDVVEQTMRGFIVGTWGAWDDARVRAESVEFATSAGGQVIHVAGSRAGVLLLREEPDHIYVRLLCLLSATQRRGIGSFVMRNVAERACAKGQALRLRVMSCNPAKMFYQRLGFVVTEATPQFVYLQYAA